MAHVAIVDYGMCNLDSVKRAVEECGRTAVITNQREDIRQATHIILPGVGAFSEAMANIVRLGLDDILSEQVLEKQISFLGICLGMQLMATLGTEDGETQGLGWIEGEVIRFQPTSNHERIPHIGWNEVYQKNPDNILFEGIEDCRDFYFVHSYHVRPTKRQEIVATTPYCGEFVSVINRDWISGVQFHPEKSQKVGFKLLKNFLTAS